MIKNMPGGEVSGPGTTVGVNVALSGTLRDQSDIAIFGLVDGEVISEKSVTVGKTAQVKGPIRGQIVTIAGVVRGSVDASEKLELQDTARIFGSINTKNLVIHSGATFVGKCSMPSDLGGEGEEELLENAPTTAENHAEPVKTESINPEDLKPEEE